MIYKQNLLAVRDAPNVGFAVFIGNCGGYTLLKINNHVNLSNRQIKAKGAYPRR